MSDETLIIGGGPAGMLLAHLLVEGGHAVHVVERHPDFDREFRGEGIQGSVVKLLRQLGLLDELLDKGIAIPAHAARVFLGETPVATLRGVSEDEDFGIILHQSTFLRSLHERLLKTGLYKATFSASAERFVRDADRITGVVVREGTERREILGGGVVVATGRGSSLRRDAGLTASPVDTHFNILWLRLPRPADPALVPDGFRAHLTGDALFILYTAADGGIQLAWSRRDEGALKDRDFARRKARLLAEAPASLAAYLDENFTPETVTHFLKVQSDRLDRWYADGALFIGDAAHTMSPVAGQGINLAMRDAVVAANHILQRGRVDDEVGAAVQEERQLEINRMQTFQRRLGYFMLGAPRFQIRAFFRLALPFLTLIGVRGRLLKQVQGGVTLVEYRPPEKVAA